jgi:hypothetical protein
MVPTGRRVAFDYEGKTVRFGEAIDEAEAERIVGELKKVHNFR